MTELVAHGIPGSPFLRAVLATAEEKAVPYRLVALAPGMHRTDAYRRMHPFSRIPVIEHGDFVLYETQAILRYLDAIGSGPTLQPTDPRAAARMNQIIGVNDWYFFPKVGGPVVFQRLIGPILLGTSPDEAVIAEALPMAQTCVSEFDRLLGASTWLAGETFSLADLMVGPQLEYLSQTPEGRALLAGTGLAEWLKRIAARPSFQATLPPEPLRQAV
ncbi:glutathione S-transferase family protein [Phenylobacterium aquaticum]|uniref:glutathione S-transferase family protein n=1 Tax=Phenylobacterium aquaticum TaxID=1763816 RepID=UPI0026F1C7D9|nr:glutathione S-transferase family protein [Phenylobacterium aquaticum]